MAAIQPLCNAASSIHIIYGLTPSSLLLQDLAVEFWASLLVIPAVLSDMTQPLQIDRGADKKTLIGSLERIQRTVAA